VRHVPANPSPTTTRPVRNFFIFSFSPGIHGSYPFAE
jgi:hypothetical protein